ncbi:MAG TPA: hypothetical protein G4N96_01015 [Chloroflexi bacterium]|nr:MAG: hypothetical protein B6243_00100 [Anaerolineaceae bacterium 4572_5.2]HEY83682.1 hypothetical protein [Chloroflexota bacterium]
MNFLKESENLTPRLKSIQQRVLIAGVVGLVLAFVGAIFNKDQFFQSYLFAYIFWIQIAIGGLIINMIHHVAGGAWSALLQRLLEAAMLVLPIMAALFLPILIGMETLYPWARPDAVNDHILQQKAPYLSVPFFIARTVFYFIAWIAIAYFLRKWSLERDKSGDQTLAIRLKNLSAPGILILGITITFASVDWMMSLEPHWYSTIYGMRFGISAFVSALSFVILVALWLRKYKPFSEIVTTKNLNDWGSFLLAGVMLWAYIAFSQYLIIWSGNLKEEIPWYIKRTEGGWQWLGLALIFIHFILPFAFLLTRNARRTPDLLMKVTAMVFIMRIIDIYWRITPAFYPEQFHLGWVDIVAWIGIGGLWLAMFTRNLTGKSLLPMNDPFLEEKTHHEHQEVSHAH